VLCNAYGVCGVEKVWGSRMELAMEEMKFCGICICVARRVTRFWLGGHVEGSNLAGGTTCCLPGVVEGVCGCMVAGGRYSS
jgi:hypothetical protein